MEVQGPSHTLGPWPGSAVYGADRPVGFAFSNLLVMRHLQERGADERARIAVGELTAKLWTLRKMSFGVATLLQEGANPDIAAALVKDLGTQFELQVIEVARSLITSSPSMTASTRFNKLLTQALFHSTFFTIRGGTTEILRGIIARGLGVR